MDNYVLDTSAILAFIENEDGAEKIDALLIQALDYQVVIAISVISLIEVFYISVQEQGEEIAESRQQQIKALPIQIVDLDISLVEVIGFLKSKHKISFADSCIAGLAKSMSANLVHKDPEFEQILDVKQLILAYKKKS